MNKKIGDADSDGDPVAYLKLINLNSEVHFFGVEESYLLYDRQTFGRAEDNDVVIADPFLSKRNTKIFFKDGAYFVEDLGGKNGTSLNGGKLKGGRPERLANGDRVNMGRLGFIFIDPYEEENSGENVNDNDNDDHDNGYYDNDEDDADADPVRQV
jgi:predicted component of type VI protein secretion system